MAYCWSFLSLILVCYSIIGGITADTSTPPPSKHVCFPDVGCFNNSPPFNYAALDLPRSPSKIGTQFLLFTREGPLNNDTVFISYTNSTVLERSLFKANRPTKFIIHGFSNTIKTEWLYTMKDALLKVGDFNVVIVAWGNGATFPDYNQAVANTRLVATQVKMMLDIMVKLGSSDDSIHLIGHSLGAHTSGYVGYLLRKENRSIARISGLDPAEPDYEFHADVIRLDQRDAVFVDVIHSNGDKFSNGGAGLMQKSGHIDFYLNGGEVQPDCTNPISDLWSHIGALFHGDFGSVSASVSCSHSRLHEVYVESISSECPYTAYPCDSYDKFQQGECLSCGTTGCAQMGYYSDYYTYAVGKMYLNTRMAPPYCGFHYGVQLNISPLSKNTKGKVSIQLHGIWADSVWLNVTRKDDDVLEKGHTLSRVLVSDKEVGRLQHIDVKFVGSGSGVMMSSGYSDVLKAGTLSLESGESGKRYLFCPDEDLRSDAKVSFNKTSTACSGN